jgi:hypothetical protein
MAFGPLRRRADSSLEYYVETFVQGVVEHVGGGEGRIPFSISLLNMCKIKGRNMAVSALWMLGTLTVLAGGLSAEVTTVALPKALFWHV